MSQLLDPAGNLVQFYSFSATLTIELLPESGSVLHLLWLMLQMVTAICSPHGEND